MNTALKNIIKKSKYKYQDTNTNIMHGDTVMAYGDGVHQKEGQKCYINFDGKDWLVESPEYKMGYFLFDVITKGWLVKID